MAVLYLVVCGRENLRKERRSVDSGSLLTEKDREEYEREKSTEVTKIEMPWKQEVLTSLVLC